MDQMEKRIRIRSSQKPMYINIDDYEKVLNAVEKAFHKNIFNNKQKTDNNKDKYNQEEIQEFEKCGEEFYDCLINEESDDYVFYLEKLVKLGTSIDGILTKIQNHLLMIKLKLIIIKKKKKLILLIKKI